jgi:hypothetical protein
MMCVYVWICWRPRQKQKCEEIFQIQQTVELYYCYSIPPKTVCGWDKGTRATVLPGTYNTILTIQTRLRTGRHTTEFTTVRHCATSQAR